MMHLLKKVFLSCIIFSFIILNLWGQNIASAAPKKKTKTSLNQEQLEAINKNLNTLTRKVYANSLFSPQENETMINIKLDLDDAMLKAVSPEYAPLYHMEANLLKKRGYKNEAIECYQTILENFSDTAFAPKARQELTKMGVTIAVPVEENSEEMEVE